MKLKLVDKREESRDTYSFFWQTEQKIDWVPGQYVYYTLPELLFPDDRGPTRQFTIASSPTEGGLIQLTTRIRKDSGFKQTLSKLEMGFEIETDGPTGSYLLDDSLKGMQVLIAGGIGITPFRSFIKYNIDNDLKIPVHLIYSNSDDDFVFKKELDSWQKEYNFIKVEYVNTSKVGRIDLKLLSSILTTHNSLPTTHFWIVGPPPFVSAVDSILEEIEIEEDNLHTEKFTGY